MDFEDLYIAADRHLLTGITAMALESAGVKNEAFTQAKGKAIRKAAAFDVERSAVLRALEEVKLPPFLCTGVQKMGVFFPML